MGGERRKGQITRTLLSGTECWGSLSCHSKTFGKIAGHRLYTEWGSRLGEMLGKIQNRAVVGYFRQRSTIEEWDEIRKSQMSGSIGGNVTIWEKLPLSVAFKLDGVKVPEESYRILHTHTQSFFTLDWNCCLQTTAIAGDKIGTQGLSPEPTLKNFILTGRPPEKSIWRGISHEVTVLNVVTIQLGWKQNTGAK